MIMDDPNADAAAPTSTIEPAAETTPPPPSLEPAAKPKRAKAAASGYETTINPLKLRQALGELREMLGYVGPLPGQGEGHRQRCMFILAELLEGE
jgi:hypothetical protein